MPKLFMRTTVTIEDALYKQALEMADPSMDKSELFREAVKTFVRAQAGKRLDALGDLIQRDLALTPPMVIVKIACGMLPAPRPPTLNNLGLLRPCHQASLYEV